MTPIRAIPPPPWRLAADPQAPHLVILREAGEVLSLATSRLGLGIEQHESEAWLRLSREDLDRLAAELERRGSPLGADLGRYLEPLTTWRLRSRTLDLSQPQIMGILNLTTDSFSGDGVGTEPGEAVRRAAELRDQGATIVDVGAETARADRPVLEEGAEAELVHAVVQALAAEGHVVSIDSYKATVAAAALDAGADAVNDISGLTLGTGAAEAAAAAGAGYVLNYSYSVPKQRPDSLPEYGDVVNETNAWFSARLAMLEEVGLEREAVVIDPGIAFGKSHDEDLQVLRRLGEFRVHGLPLLLAHSRKNYIGSVTHSEPVARDLETHLTTFLAFVHGACIFRVHDVAGTRRTLDFARALLEASAGDFAPGGDSWPWSAATNAAHMTFGEPDKPAPPGQRW